MSVKYAVLGLVMRKPSHGYAIHQAFEDQLGEFWGLNYGRIYQVLGDLEGGGLVTSAREQAGNRPPRRVYSATKAGRASFATWLCQSRGQASPFRDEFFVRLLFADGEGDLVVAQLLRDELRCRRERVASLALESEDADCYKVGSKARRLFAEAALRHAKVDLEIVELCIRGIRPQALQAARPPSAPTTADAALPSVGWRELRVRGRK